ncbi:hypothetical protein [Spirillospora sp. NPDC048824]|uniref:hypothetical protein n=1 Tax=Spirillospora sp. NPDC048824 TaxID=3364526 RepID=UPI0037200201
MDPDTPVRRTVVAADVHHYSEAAPLQQVDIQKTLIDALDSAATLSGLDRSRWYTQAQGDAELAVLPADAPEPIVIADLVRELTNQLARVNHAADPALRLRLRVAIHSGIVHFGHNGLPGPAAIETCRLLEARPLKEALSASTADLALIVSDRLFHDIVEAGYRGLRAADFTSVEVAVKEFAGTGHVRLLGGPGAPAAAGDKIPTDPVREDGRTRAVRDETTLPVELPHLGAWASGDHGIAIGGDQINYGDHYGQ